MIRVILTIEKRADGHIHTTFDSDGVQRGLKSEIEHFHGLLNACRTFIGTETETTEYRRELPKDEL